MPVPGTKRHELVLKSTLLACTFAVITALVACNAATALIPTAIPPHRFAARTNAASPKSELTVFAASSLTDAFSAIGKQFEAQYPETTITFNFSGSQQLAHQLAQGAPADVLASANIAQMQAAIKSHRIRPDTHQTFAQNRLVVIYPRDNVPQIRTLNMLTTPGIKVVLAAEAVPAGRYAQRFLDQANQNPEFLNDYKHKVLLNTVSFEQNVRAVLSKVALGEADAGIVYTSEARTKHADKIGRVQIPDTLNVIANYPIAAISDGSQRDLANQFIAFVLSLRGQATLARFGFTPVDRNVTN